MAKIRDYHKKKYGNPFFKKSGGSFGSRGRGFYYGSRGKQGEKLLRRILFAALFLAAGGGWVYFLFYSPYFAIKNIEISGLERIYRSDLNDVINSQMSEKSFFVFNQNNIFWFNEDQFAKKVNEKYALESFAIDKRVPDILRIDIGEKVPSLFWETGEKIYSIGLDGIVIQELSAEEFATLRLDESILKLAVVKDESGADIKLNSNEIEPSLVEFVSTLNEIIPNEAGIQTSSFKISNKEDAVVKVLSNEGWEIYFSKINDLNAQISKLRSFMAEKTVEERAGLQYVDLRFEDRVYYK